MPVPETAVLASGNAGKLREIAELLADTGMRVVPQSELGIAAAEETGDSFGENALIKARHAASESGLPAIADDSGLVVEALRGRPGVRSARYAGPDATDAENVSKLLSEMRDVPAGQRDAAFYCCACYVTPDESASLVAEGRWPGVILDAPRGSGGFGYDPVFWDPELSRSAAELEPEQKNARSHRGHALSALADMIRRHYA